jgi:hypothetical protein
MKRKPKKVDKTETKLYPSTRGTVGIRKYQAQAYYEGWEKERKDV